MVAALGTFPEYVKKLQELRELRDKRIFMAEIFKEYEVSFWVFVSLSS